ncbi:MAG TPA: FAD-dependent oxidoreductase [Rhizobacter sp.]|nr:FAD-dependent oxidoreductase [Rhizobacter sp.]
MKHLVLLGGGQSHLHVLTELAKAPLPSTQLTLVSPLALPLHAGMLPSWLAGHCALAAGQIPLEGLVRKAQGEFIESRAVGLDAARRSVTLADGQRLNYDVLSIDTGGVMARDAIRGAREHALFVRPMSQFIQFWDAVLLLAEERALSVVVVGSGIGAVELALAAQHRLPRTRVALVTNGGPPLPCFPLPAQARMRRLLKRGQVTLFEDSCEAITASQVRLTKGFGLACDAPLLALDDSAPCWLADSGLALDDPGFVSINPCWQSRSHPQVFAVGEATDREATNVGPQLALNLRRFAGGGGLVAAAPLAARRLQLMACGDRYGMAHWGALSAEGRWVWWLKDRLHRADLGRWRASAGGLEIARTESDHHR